MKNIEFRSSDVIYLPDGFTVYNIACYQGYDGYEDPIRVPGMTYFNDQRDNCGKFASLQSIKQFLSTHKKCKVVVSCYMWCVEEWGSDPDDGNDDCWTSHDYMTEEEARGFIEEGTDDSSTHTMRLIGPNGLEEKHLNPYFKPDDDDSEWQSEIMWQDRMMTGVDSYHESEVHCTCDDVRQCRCGAM